MRKSVRGGLVVGMALALAGGMAPRLAGAQEAKELYDKQCASCHGPQGKGDGPAGQKLKTPPGDFSKTLKAMSDADIAKVIKEGGKAVGKAPTMPGYGKKLNDAQVQALVQYIKGLAK